MSDYASATLVIYDIPEGRAGATIEAIREYEPQVEEVVAGDPIEMPDQRLDIVDELGAILEGFGVTFDFYQEAKYEYDGQGLMSLGVEVTLPDSTIVEPADWAYTGGGSGMPMLTITDVEAIMRDPGINRDSPGEESIERIAAIRRLLGTDFQAAMKLVLERNEPDRTWVIERVSASDG